MKLSSWWLLLAAFAAICCTAVNGKQINEQQNDVPALKPTATPPMTSTAASPKTPQVHISPTNKPAAENDASADVFPINLPATVEHPLQAEESNALAVTGFITKDGDIYEVENSDGVGQIESRQATNDEREHICNYGNLVVYSDVPCEKITSIKIREVEETPTESAAATATPATTAQLEPIKNTTKKPNKQPNKPTQKRPTKPSPNRPNKPGQSRPARPGQNRPAKPAQHRPAKPGQNRPAKPGQNRPAKPEQSRPTKPAQKHPTKPTKHRPNKADQKQFTQNEIIRLTNKNQIQSRRAQAINQRRWLDEQYDDDYDAPQYFQVYYRRTPQQRFIYEYDDY